MHQTCFNAHFGHMKLSFVPTTDYRHPEKVFIQKSQTFGFGQTNWADNFWGIWGTFGRFISTYFGTVGSLSMFSINQPLFLQKNQAFISNSQILILIWAAKNLRFSLCVSVVRAPDYGRRSLKSSS